jgi:hypothetical protein
MTTVTFVIYQGIGLSAALRCHQTISIEETMLDPEDLLPADQTMGIHPDNGKDHLGMVSILSDRQSTTVHHLKLFALHLVRETSKGWARGHTSSYATTA